MKQPFNHLFWQLRELQRMLDQLRPQLDSLKTIPKFPNRQALFVKEYLVDLNGTQAAIRAGYSPNGADVTAIRLIGKARIRAEIQKAMDKRAAKIELTSDGVLRELALMAFSNILDYLRMDNGDVYVDLSRLTREQAAAIQEIVVDRHIYRGRRGRNGNGDEIRRTKVKLADKISALALLGKHLKLFTELHHHTGSITLAERMKRAEEADQ